MRIATRQDMLQAFSDAFKAYHGCRPSSGYGNSFTDDELGEEILKLERWAEEVAQRDAQEDADEARAVASVMAVGCPDEATAQRWLDDAWEIY